MKTGRKEAAEIGAAGGAMTAAGAAGNIAAGKVLERKGLQGPLKTAFSEGVKGLPRNVRRLNRGHAKFVGSKLLTRPLVATGVPLLAYGGYHMVHPDPGQRRLNMKHDIAKPVMRNAVLAHKLDDDPVVHKADLAASLTAGDWKRVKRHKKVGRDLSLVSGTLGLSALGLRAPAVAGAIARRSTKAMPTVRRLAAQGERTTRASNTLGVLAIGSGSANSFNYAAQQKLENRAKVTKGLPSVARQTLRAAEKKPLGRGYYAVPHNQVGVSASRSRKMNALHMADTDGLPQYLRQRVSANFRGEAAAMRTSAGDSAKQDIGQGRRHRTKSRSILEGRRGYQFGYSKDELRPVAKGLPTFKYIPGVGRVRIVGVHAESGRLLGLGRGDQTHFASPARKGPQRKKAEMDGPGKAAFDEERKRLYPDDGIDKAADYDWTGREVLVDGRRARVLTPTGKNRKAIVQFADGNRLAKMDDQFLRQHNESVSPKAEAGYRRLKGDRNRERAMSTANLGLAGLVGADGVRRVIRKQPKLGTAIMGVWAGTSAMQSAISGQNAHRLQQRMDRIKAKGYSREVQGQKGPDRVSKARTIRHRRHLALAGAAGLGVVGQRTATKLQDKADRAVRKSFTTDGKGNRVYVPANKMTQTQREHTRYSKPHRKAVGMTSEDKALHGKLREEYLQIHAMAKDPEGLAGVKRIGVTHRQGQRVVHEVSTAYGMPNAGWTAAVPNGPGQSQRRAQAIMHVNRTGNIGTSGEDILAHELTHVRRRKPMSAAVRHTRYPGKQWGDEARANAAMSPGAVKQTAYSLSRNSTKRQMKEWGYADGDQVKGYRRVSRTLQRKGLMQRTPGQSMAVAQSKRAGVAALKMADHNPAAAGYVAAGGLLAGAAGVQAIRAHRAKKQAVAKSDRNKATGGSLAAAGAGLTAVGMGVNPLMDRAAAHGVARWDRKIAGIGSPRQNDKIGRRKLEAAKIARKRVLTRTGGNYRSLVQIGALAAGVPAMYAGTRHAVSKSRKGDVDAAAAGGVIGAASYQGLGYAGKPIDRIMDRRTKRNPQASEAVKQHFRDVQIPRTDHGAAKKWTEFNRTYPKSVPGWQWKRVRGYSHAGKVGHGLTLAAASAGAAGAVALRHKEINKALLGIPRISYARAIGSSMRARKPRVSSLRRLVSGSQVTVNGTVR